MPRQITDEADEDQVARDKRIEWNKTYYEKRKAKRAEYDRTHREKIKASRIVPKSDPLADIVTDWVRQNFIAKNWGAV